jgi:hypothetical protein
MTINLTTGSPTANATGLTAGKTYSIWHRGKIDVTAEVDGAPLLLAAPRASGGFVLVGLPATSLTFTLAGDSTAAAVELVELA